VFDVKRPKNAKPCRDNDDGDRIVTHAAIVQRGERRKPSGNSMLRVKPDSQKKALVSDISIVMVGH
jgi:hypothetical protein